MKTKNIYFQNIIWMTILCQFLSITCFGGPLYIKTRVFDENVQKYNCPNGMVFDAVLDENGKFMHVDGDGDSCIWTGAYLTSQAFRYLATKDPVALANIERTLQAFHNLQMVTGYPGFLGRSFGIPEIYPPNNGKVRGVGSYSHLLFHADTSRDQYTGLFMGYAISWPLIQNPELRETVKSDVLAIGRNLMKNNLALLSKIDDKYVTQFNLNPSYCYQDRINRHEWETVDDYPANLIREVFPFNATTASALATFDPPPMRGGEALRAVLMLHTAVQITGDPELRKFFEEEIRGRRNLIKVASETSQFLDELYKGENEATAKRIIGGVFVAFLKVSGELLVRHEIIERSRLKLLAPPAIILTEAMGNLVGESLIKVFKFFNQPQAFRIFLVPAAEIAALAESLEKWGLPKPAGKLRNFSNWLKSIAVSNIDELTDSMRSGVGTNLGFFSTLGLLASEPDPEIKSAVQDILSRAFLPIADEGNSLYTFIREGYGRDHVSPKYIKAARQTLFDYPMDQHGQSFDHSKDPGIRLLPWPDRFGRYGNMAVSIFPINQRAPDIFIWQDSPRTLVTHGNPRVLYAPVGYLLAYWVGRYRGLISEND